MSITISADLGSSVISVFYNYRNEQRSFIIPTVISFTSLHHSFIPDSLNSITDTKTSFIAPFLHVLSPQPVLSSILSHNISTHNSIPVCTLFDQSFHPFSLLSVIFHHVITRIKADVPDYNSFFLVLIVPSLLLPFKLHLSSLLSLTGFSAVDLISTSFALQCSVFSSSLLSRVSCNDQFVVVDLGNCFSKLIIISPNNVDNFEFFIGYRDFDEELVSYCLRQIPQKLAQNIASNVNILFKILAACQNCRKKFETMTRASICVEISSEFTLNLKISITEYQKICQPVVEKLRSKFEVFRQNFVISNISNIAGIVLLGGLNRLSFIKNLVINFYKLPLICVDETDSLVCHGAEIHSKTNNWDKIFATSDHDNQNFAEIFKLLNLEGENFKDQPINSPTMSQANSIKYSQSISSISPSINQKFDCNFQNPISVLEQINSTIKGNFSMKFCKIDPILSYLLFWTEYYMENFERSKMIEVKISNFCTEFQRLYPQLSNFIDEVYVFTQLKTCVDFSEPIKILTKFSQKDWRSSLYLAQLFHLNFHESPSNCVIISLYENCLNLLKFDNSDFSQIITNFCSFKLLDLYFQKNNYMDKIFNVLDQLLDQNLFESPLYLAEFETFTSNLKSKISVNFVEVGRILKYMGQNIYEFPQLLLIYCEVLFLSEEFKELEIINKNVGKQNPIKNAVQSFLIVSKIFDELWTSQFDLNFDIIFHNLLFISNFSKSKIKMFEGIISYQNFNYPKAIEIFNNCLTLDPSNFEFKIWKFRCLLLDNQITSAINLHRNFSSNIPSNFPLETHVFSFISTSFSHSFTDIALLYRQSFLIDSICQLSYRFFKKAVEMGEVGGFPFLGFYLESGLFCKKSQSESIELYSKVVESQQDSDLLTHLIDLLVENKQYSKAFPFLKILSNISVTSNFALGSWLYEGKGCRTDLQKALKFLTKYFADTRNSVAPFLEPCLILILNIYNELNDSMNLLKWTMLCKKYSAKFSSENYQIFAQYLRNFPNHMTPPGSPRNISPKFSSQNLNLEPSSPRFTDCKHSPLHFCSNCKSKRTRQLLGPNFQSNSVISEIFDFISLKFSKNYREIDPVLTFLSRHFVLKISPKIPSLELKLLLCYSVDNLSKYSVFSVLNETFNVNIVSELEILAQNNYFPAFFLGQIFYSKFSKTLEFFQKSLTSFLKCYSLLRNTESRAHSIIFDFLVLRLSELFLRFEDFPSSEYFLKICHSKGLFDLEIFNFERSIIFDLLKKLVSKGEYYNSLVLLQIFGENIYKSDFLSSLYAECLFVFEKFNNLQKFVSEIPPNFSTVKTVYRLLKISNIYAHIWTDSTLNPTEFLKFLDEISVNCRTKESLRLLVAIYYYKNFQYQESLGVLKICTTNSPSYLKAFLWTCRLLILGGNFSEALEIMKKCRELAKKQSIIFEDELVYELFVSSTTVNLAEIGQIYQSFCNDDLIGLSFHCFNADSSNNSLIFLAKIYSIGHYVPQNNSKAVDLYENAFKFYAKDKEKYIYTLQQLLTHYTHSLQFSEAFATLKRLSDLNNEFLLQLSDWYVNGTGCDANLSKANKALTMYYKTIKNDCSKDVESVLFKLLQYNIELGDVYTAKQYCLLLDKCVSSLLPDLVRKFKQLKQRL
ncbi:hypothetical protein RCL1_000933 [Eukaryota sp. TZLM3-RCL]